MLLPRILKCFLKIQMKNFRIVIAGGRDFNDYDLLQEKCLKLLTNKMPNVIVVSGGAKGADSLGERFAREHNLEVERFLADWDNVEGPACILKYTSQGKPYNAIAGHLRNKKMGDATDAGIIFWDGKSSGSKDMVNVMKILEKPYRVVNYERI